MNTYQRVRGNNATKTLIAQQSFLRRPILAIKKQGFGERIKQARLELGVRRGDFVSPEALAGELGVTGQTVRNWESEKNEPDLETFAKLAKIFGSNRIWLAFGVEVEEDPPKKPRS